MKYQLFITTTSFIDEVLSGREDTVVFNNLNQAEMEMIVRIANRNGYTVAAFIWDEEAECEYAESHPEEQEDVDEK